MITLRNWFTFSGIAVLFALLVFAFFKTNVDSLGFKEVESALTHLHRVHSYTKKNLVLIRYSQIRHYDGLTADMETLLKLSKEFNTGTLKAIGEGVPYVQLALDELRLELKQEQEQVNYFKTNFSVFKNSFIYFPKLMGEIWQQVQKLPLKNQQNYNQIQTSFNALYYNVIRLNTSTDSILYGDIRIHLQNLTEQMNAHPDLRHKANLLTRHVEIILQYKLEVDQHLNKLLQRPFAERIKGVSRAYDKHFQEQTLRAFKYKTALFLCFFIILIYLIIIARKLRSTAFQQRRMMRAVEASATGIIITDTSGIIQYSNQAFTKITGWAQEAVLGESPGVLKSGLTDRSVYEELWATLEQGEVWKGSFINRKKPENQDEEGALYWTESTIAPIKDNRGKIEGYVNVQHDITEIKKIEQELRRTQEEAVTAKEDALQANKAKGDFLANMSHEIRTPMNAVIGLSRLILQTDLSKRQLNYVKKIQSSSYSLLEIINDILDFSKIEAGKLDMEDIEFSMDDVLDNLSDLLGFKALDKGLEFLFLKDPNIPDALMGDPLRLGQVLTNLINNAIKFTESGEIVVRVEILTQKPGAIQLRFSVQDSGIGLSQAQQLKLFKAFSQADASTTRKYGGTGLGLVISKRIINQLEGEIWVESELEKGSTFYFTVEYEVSMKTQKTKADLLASSLEGNRILVVNSNRTSREILCETLQSLKFSPTSVSSCEEASLFLTQTSSVEEAPPYSLILLDCNTQKTSRGIELLRIQSDAQSSKVPLLFISMLEREESPEQNEIIMKFPDRIVKPVTPSVIFDGIMMILGKGIDKERYILQDSDSLNAVPELEESLERIVNSEVLLVEDNAINQEIAFVLLTNFRVNVSIANNGQEALDMIQEKQYDMVFMDIQMPVMDGLHATRELRKLYSLQELPIVAMTAHAMVGDSEKSLAAGMNDHITKPVVPTDLQRMLATWIKPRDRAVEEETSETLAAEIEAPTPLTQEESEESPQNKTLPDSLPDSLPGINISESLLSLGGDEFLLKKLYNRFKETYLNSFFDLKQTLSQDDRSEASRLIHTLKGLAGSFAATKLKETCVELEQSLLTNTETEAQVQAFGEALSEVLISIKTALGDEHEERPSLSEDDDEEKAEQWVDPETLSQIFRTLEEQLKEGNPDASESLDTLALHFKDSEFQKLISTLQDQVENYDFDEAQETLAELFRAVGDI